MDRMTKHPILGDDVAIDPKRLLVGRLLVQANSGGGKSRTLRRLLEQTHGIYPQFVIDPEGEFSTLREKFDYILVGPGGDCPVDIKSAGLLARKLLELGLSAIIDIYELGERQPIWVKGFLEGLMSAPRKLWRPVDVVIDEAHKFCPEKGEGESVSTAAVIDLMARGRKRGFSGWLATQRIAKLNKNAAAECNNKLIGRTSQDLDIARAAKDLGLKGDAALALRKLQPGQFYAYGPAISDEVRLVKIGPVETTHPEAGEQVPTPPPPKERIQKILGQLADLPKEAEEEAKSLGELRAKVKELEAEVRAARKANPVPVAKVETKTVEKLVIKDAQLARIGVLLEQGDRLVIWLNDAAEKASALFETASNKALGHGDKLATELGQLRAAVASSKAPTPTNREIAAAHFATDGKVVSRVGKHEIRVPTSRVYPSKHAPKSTLRPAAGTGGDTALTGPQRALLTALAWWAAMGHGSPTRAQLAGKAGWKPRGSNLRNRLSELSAAGLVEYPRDGEVSLTDAGAAAAPSPNTSDSLIDSIRGELTGPQLTVFEELLANGQRGRDSLAEAISWEPGGSNLRNRLSELSAMELVEYPQKGSVALQPWVTA